MTRIEYEAMMERVLGDAERLEVDGREVVLVMSRNIYRIICSYEQAEPLNLLNTEPYAYGAYCGMRIGVIDEPANENIEGIEDMIAPALVGMTHNPGVNRLGDVIVISEENDNRLYKMTNDNPIQFNDMGLSISYTAWYQRVDAGDNTDTEAATAAIANGIDGIRFTGGQIYINGDNGRFINVGDLAFTEAAEETGTAATTTAAALNDWAATLNATITHEGMERIAEAFNAARPEATYAVADTINYAEANTVDTYTNTARETSWAMRHKRGKRRNVAVDEQELSPGDTKLLDEFLDSFKHSSLMQMGG